MKSAHRKKEDAKILQEHLDWLYNNCKIVYYPTDGRYPIEHSIAANKDCRDLIESEIESTEHQKVLASIFLSIKWKSKKIKTINCTGFDEVYHGGESLGNGTPPTDMGDD